MTGVQTCALPICLSLSGRPVTPNRQKLDRVRNGFCPDRQREEAEFPDHQQEFRDSMTCGLRIVQRGVAARRQGSEVAAKRGARLCRAKLAGHDYIVPDPRYVFESCPTISPLTRCRAGLVRWDRTPRWKRRAKKQPPPLSWRGLEKSGDNLLSRWTHYHGLEVLNGRVRNGNGCGHLDMVTGRSLAAAIRPTNRTDAAAV